MALPIGRRSFRSPAHKVKFIGSECATPGRLVQQPSGQSAKGNCPAVDRCAGRPALMGGYRAEQPVHLAVDPVGEVEDIGAAVSAADPDSIAQRPPAERPPVLIGIVPCNLPLGDLLMPMTRLPTSIAARAR